MSDKKQELRRHFSKIETDAGGGDSTLSHVIEHVEWTGRKISIDRSSGFKQSQAIQCFRGQIFWAELGKNIGSEENKRRPVLVLQNDKGNRFGPTTIVAPISDDMSGLKYPVNVKIDIKVPDPANPNNIITLVEGVLLTGQIRVLNKSRLQKKICDLNDSGLLPLNPGLPTVLARINKACKLSLDLS